MDAGVRLEVHLTPGDFEQLDLRFAQKIWLVAKTYSCRVVTSSSDGLDSNPP